MRCAFRKPPLRMSLDEEQQEVTDKCLELESDSSDLQWRDVNSNSPFVTSLLSTERTAGARSMATSKTTSVLDCPALQALAWSYAYCSKERMKLHSSSGDTARLIHRVNTPFDSVVATVRKSTHPLLKQREFVTRQLALTEEKNKTYLHVLTSTDDVVDYGYGTQIRKNRQESTRVYRFEVLTPHSCKATLLLSMDIPRHIPNWFVVRVAPKVLKIMKDMRDCLARDEELDAQDAAEISKTIKQNDEVYTAAENDFISRVEKRLGKLDRSSMKPIESPDNQVRMGSHHVKESGSMVADAEAVVDASIEDLAGWELNKRSRKFTKQAFESRMNLSTKFHDVNRHNTILQQVVDFGYGLAPREYVVSSCWKWTDENTLVCCNEATPEDNVPEFPLNSRYVRTSMMDYWKYEKVWRCERSEASYMTRPPCTTHMCVQGGGGHGILSLLRSLRGKNGPSRSSSASVLVTWLGLLSLLSLSPLTFASLVQLSTVHGLPQTRVTKITQVSIGGLIPDKLQNKSIKYFVNRLSQMRRHFDQSFAIDEATNKLFVEQVLEGGEEQVYSEEENDLIERGMNQFTVFESQDKGTLKNVKLASPMARGRLAFSQRDNQAWGWSSAVVRANSNDVMAYMWNFMARGKRGRKEEVEKDVEETVNGHNQLVYSRVKPLAKFGLGDRDFLSRCIWKKTGEGDYFSLSTPTQSEARPPKYGVVRAKFPTAFKMTRIGDVETRLELVISPDYGGILPAYAVRFYLGRNLEKVTEYQEMFQAKRDVSLWTAEDGEALAASMSVKTKIKGSRRRRKAPELTRMKEIALKFKGIRVMAEEHEFFVPMFAAILKNRLRVRANCNTSLCNLTSKEGEVIGGSLALFLATTLTPESAVNEWIGKYPALKQFDVRNAWFRPMIQALTVSLLGGAAWGLKMRMWASAVLSMLNTGSDVYVGLLLFGQYGLVLWGMVGANVLVQVLLVMVQNAKRPGVMLREVGFVLCLIKPLVDISRIGGGGAMANYQVSRRTHT